MRREAQLAQLHMYDIKISLDFHKVWFGTHPDGLNDEPSTLSAW